METITLKNLNQFIKILDNEEWRQVKGNEKYFISNYGRCFSLYHKKLLKPILCADKNVLQYLCYKLTKDKKSKWIRVHRLVASAFIANNENKREVHHKDGNHLNNHSENLMWVNHAEHVELHKQLRQQKKSEKAA